jgi:hypothetical protein
MKALSVQVQQTRTPNTDLGAVAARFREIAENRQVVHSHQSDSGIDQGEYLNVTSHTEDLSALWELIQKALYRDPELGDALAVASIAACEGEHGWDDYLLLYHFDQTVKRDAL